MDLEFRYLRDFLTIVESGSLGDAARRLKTSQPTLTRSVKLLEQSVGGAVFDRTPQGMRPTALGRALERRARLILGELGSTQREINELVEGRRGRVVIGTGPVFGSVILPRAIARFQVKHPRVDVCVIQGLMRETLPGVIAGDIDCTFHSGPAALDNQELAHRVLLRGQSLSAVARRDHPLAGKKRISLAAIASQPWLLPRQPDYLRSRFDQLFQRAGLTPPSPLIEYNSITNAPLFLRENKLLITFVVSTMIDEMVKNRALVRLDVPDFRWRADSSVIFRRGVPLPPAAALLLDHVRAVCDEYMRR
ncbi:MAG TPA: LysR family transcriptional regulator [Stellaceae bacterium]|nr:LysR family transcriptional regulator [Stellaceae bacterium]